MELILLAILFYFSPIAAACVLGAAFFVGIVQGLTH